MELRTVFSEKEPSTNCIWIQKVNGILIQKVFTSNGWQVVGTPNVETVSEIVEMPEEITDKYVFRISDEATDLASNIDTASDIGLSKTVNVHVIGRLQDTEYDTVGVYHNGEISAVQGATHIVFKVNFNTGEITQHSYFDLSTFIEGIELEIGNSNAVKQANVEKLRKVTVKTNVFHAHIDYGIGVGTWVDGNGGFAHIVTPYGVEAFYDIAEDGTVSLNNEYINPSSLFGEYQNSGGTKTREQFNKEIFELIG